MARDTPPAPGTKPGSAPGYPETTPRDGGDARKPHPEGEKKKRDPEAGGLDREPGDDADPAD